MVLPPMSNGSPSNRPHPKLRLFNLRKGKCDFLGEQTDEATKPMRVKENFILKAD